MGQFQSGFEVEEGGVVVREDPRAVVDLPTDGDIEAIDPLKDTPASAVITHTQSEGAVFSEFFPPEAADKQECLVAWRDAIVVGHGWRRTQSSSSPLDGWRVITLSQPVQGTGCEDLILGDDLTTDRGRAPVVVYSRDQVEPNKHSITSFSDLVSVLVEPPITASDNWIGSQRDVRRTIGSESWIEHLREGGETDQSIDDLVIGGKPRVQGTRIPVAQAIGYVYPFLGVPASEHNRVGIDGGSLSQAASRLPGLTESAVLASICWGIANLEVCTALRGFDLTPRK
ncbi:hypothetical protein RYH80_18485 [Halobaculum sp. MBLA0147]|uniref:hypothetical protein n=1 Tax=Halobaculum sp. MBLA0147 TaxID=3079934 RepID=UPI00352419B4